MFTLEEYMNRKILFLLTLMLAVVVMLSACERSAVAPESQATPTGSSNDGQPTVALADVYSTQTAAGTATSLSLTMQPDSAITTPTGNTPTATQDGGTSLPTTETPVPTTPGGVSTPTAGHPATYTLQNGEFPYCIARRFNLDPAELLALNGISVAEADSLQPGLVLNLPSTGNPFPGARALTPHPASYTVLSNDTIYRIACRYGDVDPIYLAAVNGIASPYTLTVGTVLNIP